MTVLPLGRIQCDRCLTVHVLTAPNSTQWGQELFDLGWRARPIGGVYRHACALCAADEFLAEVEGRRTRYADHTERAS